MAANDALRQKQEVVFLRNSLYKENDNTLVIGGVFYNGTTDFVSGIQSMLIDVTLKNGDTEVLTIKDQSYEDPVMGSWMIGPKAS